MMGWCCNSEEDGEDHQSTALILPRNNNPISECPSCGHHLQLYTQSGIQDLPGLPAGVKFDPTDQEILEHLEAKVVVCSTMQDDYNNDGIIRRSHPLIDEFIPTLEGHNGICYTHPEKLPGVNKDGQVRHFFHRPSKAYTTGNRKRRKVHSTPDDGIETRWHKTGKTRPIFSSNNNKAGAPQGFKKILVLYTNYGRQKKPQKTNWVMHQYHLGNSEEEKDGELVVSKVFYQTQPRQCASNNHHPNPTGIDQDDLNNTVFGGGFNYDGSLPPPHYAAYYNHHQNQNDIGERMITSFPPPQLMPNFAERTPIKPSSETSVGFF